MSLVLLPQSVQKQNFVSVGKNLQKRSSGNERNINMHRQSTKRGVKKLLKRQSLPNFGQEHLDFPRLPRRHSSPIAEENESDDRKAITGGIIKD